MDKVFLKSFHIAGFSYYQGSFVFSELSIGTKLDIVLDSKNVHDDSAIELRYKGKKVGYVPAAQNEEIAAIMKAGYKIFECVIQQLSPEKHPEQQVRVGV
ncbi:MAG: HIRAN domain-containing protein, partial [Thermodesulfobacteriota bacterium]